MPILMYPHNVHIHKEKVEYDQAKEDDPALGGLVQNGWVTEQNFLQMLAIILVVEALIRVQRRLSGHIVSTLNSSLETGIYDILIATINIYLL
ncbi:hypothetical protein BDZ91DRAFT_798916 [Kalaharituber pfeilii]|nr:hypothetical protein BDZ91DRAFT_798916 [Kalaharituber pfeilii]